MAIRTSIVSGLAVASCGVLIATTPAVVTPLAERDVRVVDTQVALSASALQQLIDAYLTGLPLPGPPDDPQNGIVGVLALLTTGVPLVNSYVTGGIVGVADELTTGVPLVNSYVNGGIVGLADELTAGVPAVNAYIAGYPLIRDPDGNVVVAGPNGILGLTQFLVDTLLGDPFPPSAEAGTEARVGAMLTATVNQDDTGLAGGTGKSASGAPAARTFAPLAAT